MTKSWALDLSMAQKIVLVREKARTLGISEKEAHQVCVVEYETGRVLNEYTQNVENAYHVYMTEGVRPGSNDDVRLKIKMHNELALRRADALRRARVLEKAAKATVKERIEVKHGKGSYEKATRSIEDYEASLGLKLPNFGGWVKGFGEKVGGLGGIKKSLQVTGLVLIAFVLVIFYIIFVKGKGAEGVSVSAVGK